MSEPKIVIPGPNTMYWIARVYPKHKISTINLAKPKFIPGDESINPKDLVPYRFPVHSEFGFGYLHEHHKELWYNNTPHEEYGRRDLLEILRELRKKASDEGIDVILIDNIDSCDNGTGWKTWFTYQRFLYNNTPKEQDSSS